MASYVNYHDPIGIKECKNAFLGLWKAGGGKGAFRRLGFAISGGVDSMALAYLWNQFRSDQLDYNPYVQGFVIDHGLRPESAEEARIVASRLKPLLGKPGQIITLNWDHYGGINNVSSIETTARRLRFQALGKAALSHNLRFILMGHHADDLAETALYRLTQGSRGIGLLGMSPAHNIPECDGLFGVHKSGSFRRPYPPGSHYIGGPENGGIKIGRPLLEFPKSRLIATCKRAGIKWTEDNTNRDVSLTQRNTIRAMMKSDVLPVPLRSVSIQKFIEDIKDINEIRKDLTRKLYAATKIDSFDLRSGVMRLHLPSPDTIVNLLSQYSNRETVFEAFSALIHSLVQCVSSVDVRLETLKSISAILYKELTTGLCNQVPLSVGQIIIERTKSSILDHRACIGLRLHRARFNPGSSSSGNRPQDIILPPIRFSAAAGAPSEPISLEGFRLWDNRWWIRVQNHSSVPLRIEHLNEWKMHVFRNTMGGYNWKSHAKMLSGAAPGSSRWTIPAIVCDEAPPVESMISFKRPDSRVEDSKTKPKLISGEGIVSSSVRHPTSILKPSLSSSEDNLINQQSNAHHLIPISSTTQGTASADEDLKSNESFIVAIPTMNIFLNAYWATKLEYDIRYKALPLTNLRYLSKYIMEKPVGGNGLAKDAVHSRIVKTVNESSDLHPV